MRISDWSSDVCSSDLILDTAKHRSVKVQADDVQITTQFTDGQIRRGFEHFRKTCVACHGAPGVERTEMGKGLRPQQIGRASCRERVCQYVSSSVVAVSLKTQKTALRTLVITK